MNPELDTAEDYICPKCGAFVIQGQFHECVSSVTIPPSYLVNNVSMSFDSRNALIMDLKRRVETLEREVRYLKGKGGDK